MSHYDEAGSSSAPLLPTGDNERPALPLAPRAPLPPPKPGNHITVLSIDGGGIRGLIPAVVLQKLEEKLKLVEKTVNGTDINNVQIADYFDVVAGTSTGGLIAAMLVTPGEDGRAKYTPKEIENFYMKNGPKIFPSKRWWWWGPLGMIRAWWGPKYKGTFLQDEIKRQVDQHTVNGEEKKMTLDNTLCKIVIPTFDIHRMEPVIFSSFHAPGTNDARKPDLSNICIGTSAAPTFFPAHHFMSEGIKPSQYHLIDGGVAANNPTMAAISMVTRDQLTNKQFLPNQVDYKKYIVISVGTGSEKGVKGEYTAKSCAKWGALNWVYNWRNTKNPIIDIFSEATAVLVDFQVRLLLYNTKLAVDNQKYLRIQAQGSFLPMDDADDADDGNMKNLVKIARGLLDKGMAMVDLISGKYEPFVGRKGQKVRTNSEELERFARLLVEERNLRLKEPKKNKAGVPKTKGTYSLPISPTDTTSENLDDQFGDHPDNSADFDQENHDSIFINENAAKDRGERRERIP